MSLATDACFSAPCTGARKCTELSLVIKLSAILVDSTFRYPQIFLQTTGLFSITRQVLAVAKTIPAICKQWMVLHRSSWERDNALVFQVTVSGWCASRRNNRIHW